MSKREEPDPKALIRAQIKTTCDILNDRGNRTIPKGATGVVIECYDHPAEAYCVDSAIPNPNLVGGHEYENAILNPDQIEIIEQGTGSLE